jgi:phosphate transport system permease protein
LENFPLTGRLKDVHFGDRVFASILRGVSVFVSLLLLLIGYFLWNQSRPAFEKFGLGFVATSTWDPVQGIYGAAPVIYGTLVSSMIALAIATPLSVGIALFLTEIAPRRLATFVSFLVQMLAAIPSVVYGLWGIFVLAPWLRTIVQPFLGSTLGFLPLFQGPPYGVGMMAAGIILAIMITPTISAISTEVFRAIPRAHREAALALGSTRWEMMLITVLQSSKPGIFSAVILGLGRALGETMAVTMVIGNRAQISPSIFEPAQTMASVIANEYAEASDGLHLASLAAIGLTLFAVTFIVNALARLLVGRLSASKRAF